jgi:hypothetical protein
MYERAAIWLGLRGCVAIFLLLSAFGCSSSLFTEDKKSELEQARGDGSFNQACLGLNLSKAELDVPTTRSLITCLNSNGGLQSYDDLVRSLSDPQLQVLLDTFNHELLSNNVRMKAVDASFKQMDERGILARLLEKSAKILSNGKLIRSGVRLLRQGSLLDSGTARKLNPDIVQSVKILSRELGYDANGRYSTAAARANLANALEMGVRTTALKSFKALGQGLRSDIPLYDRTHDLKFFTERGLEYFKTKIREDRALAKALLWGIEDGSLFVGFDHYFYDQCERGRGGNCESQNRDPVKLGLDHQIQAMESFLRLLALEKKDELLGPTVRLFRVMDDPISCMAGTKTIPNADMHVMQELAKLEPLEVPQWTMRTNLLKMTLANSMCQFPSDGDLSFNDLISVLRELAREAVQPSAQESRNNTQGAFGRPLVTIAHFLKGLELGDEQPMSSSARKDLKRYMNYPENERYRRFLIHWLGDKNRDVNAYTHLADAIGEVSRPERGVVGNLLYLVNAPAPNSKDREDVRSAIRTVMIARAELNGRSIYDVFTDSLLKVDLSTLYDLFLGTSELIDLREELANPLLEVARETLLMNDANPLVEIALSLGVNADQNELLVQTLFDIADTTQFDSAMQLTARMAENGTLRELLKGVLMMFSGRTTGIPAPNPLAVAPVNYISPDRDRSTADRAPWAPIPPKWPENSDGVDACYALNLDLGFGNPFPGTEAGRLAWEQQINKVAACSNAKGDKAELESFLKYLVQNQVSQGKSAIGALVEIFADLIPSGGDLNLIKQIYDEFSDLLTDSRSFQDVQAMNDILPFLFGKQYCTSDYDKKMPVCERGAEQLSVVQGLARSFSVIANEDAKLQSLLNVAKVAVEDARMPKAVAFNYDASNEAERRANDPKNYPFVVDKKPPLVSYPINSYPKNEKLLDLLKQQIREFEGVEPTEKLIRQKNEDYFKQPLPGELKYYKYGNKWLPGYKDAPEFKKSVKPLLDELAKGDRIKATLTFFERMHKDPYTPEWWAGWFRRLANNVEPIPYYYPGTYPPAHKPTVRFVNQLELLELVVGNADFTLAEVDQMPLNIVDKNDNFGIKYLTLLGIAGDNITGAVDRMDRELRLFWSMHNRTKGIKPASARDFIMRPEVRRRIYNLHYIFPILRKLDKVTEFTNPDGSRVYANDLGILRDLFAAILKAAPSNMFKNPDRAYLALATGQGLTEDTDLNTDLAYRRKINPLAIIAEMVRFGLLKNISVNMWYVNPESKLLNDRGPFGVVRYDNASELTRGKPLHVDDMVDHALDGPDHIFSTLENRHIVPQQVSQVLRFLTDAAVMRETNRFKQNEDAVAVLQYLLQQDCDRSSKPEYRDLPCVVGTNQNDPRTFDERYQFFGRLFSEFFGWIANDDRINDEGGTPSMAYIKRAGFNLSKLLDRLADDDRPKHVEFINQFVKVLKPALGTARGTALLRNNLDVFESLFSDAEAPQFLELLLNAEDSSYKWPEAEYTQGQAFDDMRGLGRKLVSTLAANDAAVGTNAIELLSLLDRDVRKRFEAASNAIDWMKADPEYIEFKQATLDRIVGNVVHWLPKESLEGRSCALRPRMQQHLATHLGNGNIRNLVSFVGKQSSGADDRFYNQIKFVGDRNYVREFNDFLELLRSGIVDAYPSKQ